MQYQANRYSIIRLPVMHRIVRQNHTCLKDTHSLMIF